MEGRCAKGTAHGKKTTLTPRKLIMKTLELSTMTNQDLINKLRWIKSKAKQGFKTPYNGSRAVLWLQRKYFHDNEALEVLDHQKYIEEAQRRGLI